MWLQPPPSVDGIAKLDKDGYVLFFARVMRALHHPRNADIESRRFNAVVGKRLQKLRPVDQSPFELDSAAREVLEVRLVATASIRPRCTVVTPLRSVLCCTDGLAGRLQGSQRHVLQWLLRLYVSADRCVSRTSLLCRCRCRRRRRRSVVVFAAAVVVMPSFCTSVLSAPSSCACDCVFVDPVVHAASASPSA